MLRLACVLVVSIGCGAASEPVVQPPEPGAVGPAYAPEGSGGGSAAPRQRAEPGPKPPACADFAAVAGQPLEKAERLDLDTDGLADAALGTEGCGLRCTYRLYRQARDGCWVPVGEVRDLMGAPACSGKPAPNTWCRLSGMRLMIHGDAQEYTFGFDGTRYDSDGIAGEHYVPPRQRPQPRGKTP
jgi:hypothetical protein